MKTIKIRLSKIGFHIFLYKNLKTKCRKSGQNENNWGVVLDAEKQLFPPLFGGAQKSNI